MAQFSSLCGVPLYYFYSSTCCYINVEPSEVSSRLVSSISLSLTEPCPRSTFLVLPRVLSRFDHASVATTISWRCRSSASASLAAISDAAVKRTSSSTLIPPPRCRFTERSACRSTRARLQRRCSAMHSSWRRRCSALGARTPSSFRATRNAVASRGVIVVRSTASSAGLSCSPILCSTSISSAELALALAASASAAASPSESFPSSDASSPPSSPLVLDSADAARVRAFERIRPPLAHPNVTLTPFV